jgi:hypothetical protein
MGTVNIAELFLQIVSEGSETTDGASFICPKPVILQTNLFLKPAAILGTANVVASFTGRRQEMLHERCL